MSPCGRWMIYCRGGALIKAMLLVLLHDVKPFENVPVHLHIHEGSLTTRVLLPCDDPEHDLDGTSWKANLVDSSCDLESKQIC